MAKKEKDEEDKDPTKDEEEADSDNENDNDEGQDEEGEGDPKKKRRKRKRKRKAAKEDEDKETGEEAADPASNKAVDDDTARTVFVEGVPYDATQDQVADVFITKCGIQREDITDLRFPTWQDSGRMRGYGHVVFSTTDIIQKVLHFAHNSGEKLWIGKRYLSLQQARPRGLGPASAANRTSTSNPSKTIMIKNLDYDASEEDVLAVMKQFGPIVEGGVRIARNSQTRQNKGFAYVEFEDLAAAKKAMAKTPSTKPLYILKRACILDYDEGRVKGSFKTASGKLWSKEYKDTNQNKARDS